LRVSRLVRQSGSRESISVVKRSPWPRSSRSRANVSVHALDAALADGAEQQAVMDELGS
jgi:hypothetical protein